MKGLRRGQSLILAVLLGVLVRFPFWTEAMRTPLDGDTSIIGLMALHPGEGITMWGQPYGSPLEAWLAAPLVAALGPTPAALRFVYFLLGLALIPVAYALAGALHPKAALPAAFLLACPPPYFLLLSALPPPLYPATLLLCGLLLLLAIRLGARLAAGQRPLIGLGAWGALAGLAVWTHLMSSSVVAASGVHLFLRARGRRRLLAAALLPFLLASAPWWGRALAGDQATRIVSLSGRGRTMAAHLRDVLPALHRPLGGVLGLHVPLIADDPDHLVRAPGWVAAALVLAYGVSLVLVARAATTGGDARLLLASAALALVAFPFPLRSGPHAVRFLSPLYLPIAVAIVWAAVTRGGARRAWLLVLTMACLHLLGGARLLSAWRSTDRASAPFLLPDLAPVRHALGQYGIRRAYASYGPAYRLTYESAERIVASQPWNERFLHHPLPYLDEVRFAKNVAWVLTPTVPSDLPSPDAFEAALRAAGGTWKRTEAGPAIVFHGFVPPFGPEVEPLASAGPAGDADLATRLAPDPLSPLTLRLAAPEALDGVTLTSGLEGPPLLRSMDVEVSADGAAFETVARRRRRGEREDLRWANGHPQYVLENDFLAIPLGGRTLAALRITPVASGDPWGLGEVLLHPARRSLRGEAWGEWLDPNLSWDERRRALARDRRPDREDWYFRLLKAARRER